MIYFNWVMLLGARPYFSRITGFEIDYSRPYHLNRHVECNSSDTITNEFIEKLEK